MKIFSHKISGSVESTLITGIGGSVNSVWYLYTVISDISSVDAVHDSSFCSDSDDIVKFAGGASGIVKNWIVSENVVSGTTTSSIIISDMAVNTTGNKTETIVGTSETTEILPNNF